jgi:hypothetical protein
MCTVSFVATNSGFVITSNRDETALRSADFPREYIVNNHKIFYPKDPLAGGTWYAVNQNGTVAVLLNGAADKHEHCPPYNRSRGLVVLEILAAANPFLQWQSIDLNNVEPFTIVLFQQKKLYQLRWNGIDKSTENLAIDKNHIWSSSTLYNSEIRRKRASWFFDFVAGKNKISSEDLLNFHENTHSENSENGLVINRNNVLKTLSITQSIVSENQITLRHKDLLDNKTSEIEINIQ